MEQVDSKGRRFFRPFQRIIVTLAAVLISIGQWSDTKKIAIDIYEAVVTNFTHVVELKDLQHVKVGGNIQAIEDTFGIATLIKPSQTHASYEYRYYPDSKYILIVAVEERFIVGYQVISLNNTFNPNIPFSLHNLGLFNYIDFATSFEDFHTDNANLTYFLERHSLGHEGLFLEQFIGYVDFGAKYSQLQTSKASISELNRSILNDNRQRLRSSIHDLRNSVIPNTYGMGRIDTSTAADMLITRYEYLAYFEES